jgi:hypothetical protein
MRQIHIVLIQTIMGAIQGVLVIHGFVIHGFAIHGFLTLIPMAQIVHRCGLALAAKLCMLGSAQTIFRYNSMLGKASTIFLKIG